MRGFSLEETGLYSGESEPVTRAISPECGHEFEVCVGLIFGIPSKITRELGQRMPTWLLCAWHASVLSDIIHALPETDQMSTHLDEVKECVMWKQNEKAPHKEGDCNNVIVILT